jgi:hypothetical protein
MSKRKIPVMQSFGVRLSQMRKTLVKSKLTAKPCAPRIQPSVN